MRRCIFIDCESTKCDQLLSFVAIYKLGFYFQVVDVLNPLAREYKSIGTLKKDLAELQEELAQAHKQVSKCVDKLA